MVGSIKAKIYGGRELERALNDLPDKMARRDGGKSLRAGAEIIAEEMRRTVHIDRDAPHIRDNIVVKMMRAAKGKLNAVIGFLKEVSWRVHFLEYGTVKSRAFPFVRPAIDGKGEESIDEIGKKLWEAIEREARKAQKAKP
jgi:HK97 gp10 family phage protein